MFQRIFYRLITSYLKIHFCRHQVWKCFNVGTKFKYVLTHCGQFAQHRQHRLSCLVGGFYTGTFQGGIELFKRASMPILSRMFNSRTSQKEYSELLKNAKVSLMAFAISYKILSQQAEAIFNKILDSRNKTYPGLISMLQGFQKCIAGNPSK